VLERVDNDKIPDAIARLNYVVFGKSSDFSTSIEALGPVDKPNPDPNGCKDDKGREALKEFIVARCDAP